MLRYGLLLCIVANTVHSTYAQKFAKKIIAAEHTKNLLLIQADTQKLKAILHPALTYWHSNGMLDTRQSLMQSIASKNLIHVQIDIQQSQIKKLNPRMAMIYGHCTYSIIYHKIPMQLPFVFTHIYKKTNGKWLLWYRMVVKENL